MLVSFLPRNRYTFFENRSIWRKTDSVFLVFVGEGGLWGKGRPLCVKRLKPSQETRLKLETSPSWFEPNTIVNGGSFYGGWGGRCVFCLLFDLTVYFRLLSLNNGHTIAISRAVNSPQRSRLLPTQPWKVCRSGRSRKCHESVTLKR